MAQAIQTPVIIVLSWSDPQCYILYFLNTIQAFADLETPLQQ